MALHCSSTLEYLVLSGTDISSVPESIKRFVRLKELSLVDCKQLQEILELPPNIEAIYATGCISLESFPVVSRKFQFNTCNLQELEWIDLARCHKMLVNIGNHVKSPLLGEGHFKELLGGIVFPGNEIPDWFNHRKEASNGHSCEIDINGLLYFDISGIALCAHFVEPILTISQKNPISLVGVNIIGNGVQRCIRERALDLMGSEHVWLEYSILEPFELKDLDNLRVEFYCYSSSVFLESCGVHLTAKDRSSEFLE